MDRKSLTSPSPPLSLSLQNLRLYASSIDVTHNYIMINGGEPQIGCRRVKLIPYYEIATKPVSELHQNPSFQRRSYWYMLLTHPINTTEQRSCPPPWRLSIPAPVPTPASINPPLNLTSSAGLIGTSPPLFRVIYCHKEIDRNTIHSTIKTIATVCIYPYAASAQLS